MELNTLFATVLRSLGFDVVSTGGRVSSQVNPNGGEIGEDNGEGWYYGFAHMVNIVTIEGRRYLVDVGFGAGGLVSPVLFEDGVEREEYGRCVRLRWGALPDSEDSEAKVWHLEQRGKGREEWRGMYCFPDRVEFTAADFEVLNCFASSSRKSFYVGEVVVVKFVMGMEGEGIMGEIVLVGRRLHWKIRGRKAKIHVCENEQERVQALERFFGVRLEERERLGIMGMGSCIEGE